MNLTYLLIGGNLGNRLENLQQAREWIGAEAGPIVSASSIYETAAWGKTDQPAFLNQVLLVQTQFPPQPLLEKILSIEQLMGRRRMEKLGPRLIDIDILFFNESIVDAPGLSIPHPQLHLRRFTMEPLNEIAPDYIHPVFHKTIAELLRECPDLLAVKKL